MMSSIGSIGSFQASQSIRSLGAYTKQVEALSTGQRLNSAADGAAEMAISNQLAGDIAGIRQGIRNVRDGVSMFQTAEGSLDTVSNNLVRMKELSVQAQSGTYSEQQVALIQREFAELAAQNTQIGMTTKYNGIPLHSGSQTVTIRADGNTSLSLGMQDIPAVVGDLTSDPAQAAQDVEKAIADVSTYRGELGSGINRLSQQSEVLADQAENVLAAKTRISSTDMARTVASESATEIKASVYAQQIHSQTVQQVASLFFG